MAAPNHADLSLPPNPPTRVGRGAADAKKLRPEQLLGPGAGRSKNLGSDQKIAVQNSNPRDSESETVFIPL
jgi:hypothetical protein